MRARERQRVERHARALMEQLTGDADSLTVAWSRHPLPHPTLEVHAVAFTWDTHAVIVIDECVFARCTPDEREDTIRHEIAHVIAWRRYGHDIADHGPEWARVRREIDDILDEELDAT
jgi:hypothetical protein